MAVAHQQGFRGPADQVEVAVAKAKPWIEPVARLGYAAKGFVYGLIGVVALLASWNVHVGERGNDTNQRGILNFVGRQPLGSAILIAIAVGLVGYSAWRLISATVNAEQQPVLKRLGYAFSGLAYGYLAVLAGAAAFGRPANPDDRGLARNLMDRPYGQILVIVAGLIVLAIAVVQAWNAAKAGFKKVLKLDEMRPWERVAAVWLGRAGLAARAVLFGMIGGFLITAGIRHNVYAAGGITKALSGLQRSPGGNYLFDADCVGLICYGFFMLFEARYRRIHMADPQLEKQVNGSKP